MLRRLARWGLLGACLAGWGALAQAAGAAAPQGLPEVQATYLAELQARATALGLARDPMWHKLLHYHRHPLLGVLRSLADDAGFFNHPQGDRDPAAELSATLAAFFDTSGHHALQQTAQCRFAARRAWLHERLQFDPALLPAQPCERLDAWRAGLDAARVTLVFPTAYLNSPASMYGHTLLRLDAHGNDQQPLLSYAISYAAEGNETDGLAFAIRGVFGGYAGVFSNSPYYLRIRDYTHLENRDIWEYELNLDEGQIERLVLHAWELGFTRFDYYFFDENCAYHLLSLLDVARPDLDLSGRFTWWAIPVDTVRAVAGTPGLLRERRYRPSNSTELRWRAEQMPPGDVAWAQQLARGERTPAQLEQQVPEPQRRAQVLELAERYLTFLGARGEVSGPGVQRDRVALLAERARLPGTPAQPVPVPAVAPEAGHGTGRVELEFGRREGADFWQFSGRTAYHDLMDPEPGFSRGAHIQFARLELSRESGHGIRLDRFRPVEIVSLTPREPLVDGASWKVRFGVERTWPRAGAAPSDAELAFEVNGGPGYAMELARRRRALGYAMLDNQLWYDPALGRRRWALGTGLQVGLVGDLSPPWRVHLQAYHRAYAEGAPAESGWLVQQRIVLDTRHNLTARCQHDRREGQPSRRLCSVGVQRYW